MNILLIIIAIAWILTSIYSFYLTYKLKRRCRKIENEICRLYKSIFAVRFDLAVVRLNLSTTDLKIENSEYGKRSWLRSIEMLKAENIELSRNLEDIRMNVFDKS